MFLLEPDVQQDHLVPQLNARWWGRLLGSTIRHAYRPAGRPVSTCNLVGTPRSVSFLPRTPPQRPCRSSRTRGIARATFGTSGCLPWK